MIPEDIELSPPKKRKNKNKASEVKKEQTPVPIVKEVPPVIQQEPMPIIDNPFLKSVKKIPNNN